MKTTEWKSVSNLRRRLIGNRFQAGVPNHHRCLIDHVMFKAHLQLVEKKDCHWKRK